MCYGQHHTACLILQEGSAPEETGSNNVPNVQSTARAVPVWSQAVGAAPTAAVASFLLPRAPVGDEGSQLFLLQVTGYTRDTCVMYARCTRDTRDIREIHARCTRNTTYREMREIDARYARAGCVRAREGVLNVIFRATTLLNVWPWNVYIVPLAYISRISPRIYRPYLACTSPICRLYIACTSCLCRRPGRSCSSTQLTLPSTNVRQ